MRVWHIPDLAGRQLVDYAEFLQVPSLSMGIYKLAAGAIDEQSPHREDEVYYVLQGRAKVDVEGEVEPVQAGSLIFVPAQAQHRFVEIEDDLVLLVFFAPAHTG